MNIRVAASSHPDTASALEEVCQQLTAIVEDASLVVFNLSQGLDAQQVTDGLHQYMPGAAILGGTSCQGTMTSDGYVGGQGAGLGVFVLSDPQGGYGVGSRRLGEDPAEAATAAVLEALAAAGRPGEVPSLVWLIGAPGHEERVLEGIASVLGPDVPVAGGSSADDAVAGGWQQVAGQQVHADAVVLAVLFPSTAVGYAFHSGYSPTEVSGRVTAAAGRTVHAIDGESAAAVYNRWTAGAVAAALPEGGNVLGDTTLFPLGREVGRFEQLPYYRLSHPEAITAEGGLRLFSEIAVGDELVLMQGSRESLVSRAGRVAESAMRSRAMAPGDVAGALVIYCAGCMLTVQSEMDAVAASLRQALDGAPLLGTFTFGEQGCFREGENYHGNLMISVVVFGRD